MLGLHTVCCQAVYFVPFVWCGICGRRFCHKVRLMQVRHTAGRLQCGCRLHRQCRVLHTAVQVVRHQPRTLLRSALHIDKQHCNARGFAHCRQQGTAAASKKSHKGNVLHTAKAYCNASRHRALHSISGMLQLHSATPQLLAWP